MESTSAYILITNLNDVATNIEPEREYEFTLQGPSVQSRELLKSITLEFLKKINYDKVYNLLCLCLEEIISNSVKANVKRAYFLLHNLDITKHEEYEKGMKDFKEQGIGNIKDKKFIEQVNQLGLYVKMYFKISNDSLFITTRNNSVISKEELERINKRLKISENKSPEDIFMNSIDQTEGAGLGIIMIKKIMSQISKSTDCFSISATETETITALQIKE